ncbi:hypothetical protein [Nonomuraea sp. NPDC049784]|uniref:hypothetical protein n=1 Tax=Nonomuraea sp. NPDC049784 TaxID=3154361 RepID=UPI0033D8754C
MQWESVNFSATGQEQNQEHADRRGSANNLEQVASSAIGLNSGSRQDRPRQIAIPKSRHQTIQVTAGARRGLAAARYDRVQVVHGDGAAGRPENAPYDRIIVAAGAWEVPPAWRIQLVPGGRLVVPLRFPVKLACRGVPHARRGARPLAGDPVPCRTPHTQLCVGVAR